MCVHSNTMMRSTFETPLDVERALSFQMEGLLARGYAGKSDMDPIKLIPMTDIAKLIQTEGTRYHTSGAVLEKIRASYVIERQEIGDKDDEERSEASWKITAIYGEVIPVLDIP